MGQRLCRLLLTLLVALFGVGNWTLSSALAHDLLTVTGKVGKTNRPAFTPFRDALFKYHGRSFGQAFAFDAKALGALPQKEVHTFVEGWEKPIRAKGPLLTDVLAAAGVALDATITVVSLDGYAAEFSSSERAAQDWVVATEVDGTPLGIGGRGPTWLLHDTGGKPIGTDLEGKWVWSAFMIAAE